MNALAKDASTERALAHADKQAQPPTVPAEQEPRTFVELLESPGWREKMAAKLPSSMTLDRLKGVVLSSFVKQPKLQRCTPMSVYQALTECATYDIWPGAQGHAYLVPYNNKKKGPDGRDLKVDGREVWEDCCQFMLGYRGMIELGYRSGMIEPGSFQASPVYEGDDFDFAYGTESFIKHRPKMLGERGQLVGFYAVCRPKGARAVFDVMRKDEVDLVRGRSKSKDSGPWVTDYNAMACKTVLRRFWKMLPSAVTEKYADLLERDADAEFGDLTENVRREKVASVTGEVKNKKPAWTPEQEADLATIRAELHRVGGESAESEGIATWKRMKYDEPDDTIAAFQTLLDKYADKAPAPTVAKTIDDARALIQRVISDIGDEKAGALIEPIMDEFGAPKLADIKPDLLGEFCEKLETKYDEHQGRA